MKQASKESPATFDPEGTIKGFLKGLEICAPAILDTLAEITVAAQKHVAAMQQHLAPFLEALAQIDWAEVKRRLDELPEKSKAAMILASSKGWFLGWHDSLQGLMELIEKLEATRPEDIDEVMAQYYRLKGMSRSLLK
jgi:hypothetical protein